MAHIGRHPAPGLGELIPGSFVVPQNPIMAASYIPHIGELLPASFVIPQNPLIAAMLTPAGTGMPNNTRGLTYGSGLSGLGGGCGCRGGMCGCGMSGLGLFEDPMTLALLAGGVLMVLWGMAPGGREYHEGRKKLRETYQRQVAYLKARSRGYRRVARRTVGAVERGVTAAKTAVA